MAVSSGSSEADGWAWSSGSSQDNGPQSGPFGVDHHQRILQMFTKEAVTGEDAEVSQQILWQM